ncbi:hypothetical protein P7K49_037769 [Saguinus oedipus]|uniref:CREG-like beta-barrel domain-containing protein n=1 Tax=Saguinus oedipus TaxID=9490 RepID=A0ABQ9TJ10_SAGOE|nr:hypothetical protein P7K49_037769 [Saguinus oedipus]
MTERTSWSARALLAALLASALLALLVSPARGRGGRDHGDWDEASRLPPLPPREDAARVARFVTHVCDWGALATISTLEAVRGRPFSDVLSLSDGPPGSGSGVPYFYLSPLQLSVSNLQVSGARGFPRPAAESSPKSFPGSGMAAASPPSWRAGVAASQLFGNHQEFRTCPRHRATHLGKLMYDIVDDYRCSAFLLTDGVKSFRRNKKT